MRQTVLSAGSTPTPGHRELTRQLLPPCPARCHLDRLANGREMCPATLLATFAHEMGHGLTAMLVGEQFDQLLLNADGSGVAMWRGNPGRLATALVAATAKRSQVRGHWSVAGVALPAVLPGRSGHARGGAGGHCCDLGAHHASLPCVSASRNVNWSMHRRMTSTISLARRAAPDGGHFVPVVVHRPRLHVFGAGDGQRHGPPF